MKMTGRLHNGYPIVVSPACPENGRGRSGGRYRADAPQVKPVHGLPEGSPDVTVMESIGCFEDLPFQIDLGDRQGNGTDIYSKDTARIVPLV
jgi:hypothetical protein